MKYRIKPDVATSDIEVEYDPKVWNCLALVTPPKINEPYRVIYESRRYLGWWDGYDFEFPEGFSSKNFTKTKVLFKPWDDDLEGIVCLSVEKAKQVQRAVVLARYLTKCVNHEEELSNLFDKIDNRIKKAEKANADN